jgi:ribonuclease HI
VIIPEKGKKRELSGRVAGTTNNRMELQAPLEALRSLPASSRLELYTDSTYVQKGITSWINGWRNRGWLTRDKEPVKNRDLWEALDRELQRHTVEWFWVKGHVGNSDNERADVLAATARGRVQLPLADETAIHIFMGITWKQKSKVGSWAAVLRYQQHIKVIGGVVHDSSANRIHITSVSCALASLKRRLPIRLYTTSGYLKDGASSWLRSWIANDWQTRAGTGVSNRSEWQELSEVLAKQSVTFYVIDKEMPPCHSQEAKILAGEWAALPENIMEVKDEE